MTMALEYQIITTKEELLAHKEAILTLFQSVFEKPLNEQLWTWLYIDNVVGEPIVSLCYHGDLLVGHFAVIPSSLVCGERSLVPIQSLTTMIHSDFRGDLLFLKLPQMVFKEAQRQQFQFLIGFPNQELVGPVKAIYKWTIYRKYAALMSGFEIKKHYESEDFGDRVQLNMNDLSFRTWRLGRPGVAYNDHGDYITKIYDGVEELLYFNENGLDNLDDDVDYKVLLDDSDESFKHKRMPGRGISGGR